MNNDLAQINFPVSFLERHPFLRLPELIYARDCNFIFEFDLIELFARWWAEGYSLLPIEIQIASLASDEKWRLHDLLEKARKEVQEENTSRINQTILFLALLWLFEQKDVLDDPLSKIELLYADFDSPDEISGLVRYLPAKAGEIVGDAALFKIWESYLLNKNIEFSKQIRKIE
jgi:hypothetical protein